MDAIPGTRGEGIAREMAPDGSMVVYEFAGELVKKAGRMLLRAAYVRDDNPYIERRLKVQSTSEFE